MHDLYKRQFDVFIEDIREKVLGYSSDEIRIVITGDIAHQKINISNEQVMFTANIFRELMKIGKLVIIPGNHDFLENNFDRLDSITPIVDLIGSPNIVYHKDSGVYKDENIKWVVYSLYQHNQRPEFKKEGDEFYIGLFHGPIQGMATDLGFIFEDAYDKLNFVDLDLLLCGDIHKRQTFKLPSGGYGIMIGSFLQNNFGETINHHGYGMYDVIENDYTFHDLPNEQPFLHFKITDIQDIENGKELLVNVG